MTLFSGHGQIEQTKREQNARHRNDYNYHTELQIVQIKLN